MRHRRVFRTSLPLKRLLQVGLGRSAKSNLNGLRPNYSPDSDRLD